MKLLKLKKNKGEGLVAMAMSLLVVAVMTAFGVAYINNFWKPQKLNEAKETIKSLARKAQATDFAVLDPTANFSQFESKYLKQSNGKILLSSFKKEVIVGQIKMPDGTEVLKGYIGLKDLDEEQCVGLVAPLSPAFYETFVVPHDSVNLTALTGVQHKDRLVNLVPAPSLKIKDPRSKVNATRLANQCAATAESPTKDVMFFIQREYEPSSYGWEMLDKQIAAMEKSLQRNFKSSTKTDDDGNVIKTYNYADGYAFENRIAQLKELARKRDRMKLEHEAMLAEREKHQEAIDGER